MGDAQQRLQQYGSNVLTARRKESGWQAFLRQYRDFMQIVLLGAAVLSLVVTREWGTRPGPGNAGRPAPARTGRRESGQQWDQVPPGRRAAPDPRRRRVYGRGLRVLGE
jgi:hypothetical protein